MNDIQIFTFKTNTVRTALDANGEVCFCLPDVASILELEKATPSRFNLDLDGVHKMSTIDSLGRQQEVNFISEPNLYRVIFRSNKEQAKQFQNWVFNDVLPSIRKTGTYLTPKQQFLLDILDSKDDLSRAVAINKYELGYVKPLEEKVEKTNLLLKEALPKANFYDIAVTSSSTIDIGEAAKILKYKATGRNNLFKFLRREGVLMKNNAPKQEYVNKGWFKLVEYKVKLKHLYIKKA